MESSAVAQKESTYITVRLCVLCDKHGNIFFGETKGFAFCSIDGAFAVIELYKLMGKINNAEAENITIVIEKVLIDLPETNSEVIKLVLNYTQVENFCINFNNIVPYDCFYEMHQQNLAIH